MFIIVFNLIFVYVSMPRVFKTDNMHHMHWLIFLIAGHTVRNVKRSIFFMDLLKS